MSLTLVATSRVLADWEIMRCRSTSTPASGESKRIFQDLAPTQGPSVLKSWAQAFEALAKERGIRLGQGTRSDLTSASGADVLAKELGVKPRTLVPAAFRATGTGTLDDSH